MVSCGKFVLIYNMLKKHMNLILLISRKQYDSHTLTWLHLEPNSISIDPTVISNISYQAPSG